MNSPAALTVAAAIAIAAVAVAVWWAQRRRSDGVSADELERQRHEERTPRLEISVVGRTTVRILNTGPQDLDDIVFRFVGGDIAGARVGLDFASADSLGPVAIGQARTFEAVERDPERGGEARLRLTGRAGSETWVVGGYFEVKPATKADTA